MIEALRRTALFHNLADEDHRALAGRATERRLARGETLFLAGQPATGLYVVVEGAVRAYRVSTDGREQVIHVERGGATLGEVPVFDGGPCPSSTAAEEDSVLLFLPREDVVRLCLERPQIGLAALRLLAGRMRNCAALVERLALRDVDRRVAQLLLDESRNHEQRAGSAVAFSLALTHAQIASRVGSVREVVSRSLSRLQTSGLITVEGRNIRINNIATMRDYASE